jgi:carbon-monoxide dehydrogenase large subunit
VSVQLADAVVDAHHPEVVTGRSEYVDDVHRPNALAAAIVRSPEAHARILAVDASAALASAGVRAVLTAADLQPVPFIPIRSFPHPWLEARRQPVLATDRVRYVGEPVAVVVADDPYLAEDAAEAVMLDLEPLPAVIDPDAPDPAPLFGPGLDNRLCHWEAGDGNVDAACAAAALVVEETFETGRHTGVPMETRGLVAEWSDDGRTLEVWGATKFISFTQRALADWFGVELDRVLCHHVDVGGMFGVRGELYPEDFLIPWAAQAVGRPVKWIEDRREHLLAINHARGMRVTVSLAVDGDGRFLALRSRAVVDMGAYARPIGARIPLLAIEEMPGPYRYGAHALIGEGRATTKTPVGTVRAPVALECTFARERVIDIAAVRLGLDAAEIRRRNLVTPDELPFTRRYGHGLHDQHYDSGDFPAMLDGLLARAAQAGLPAARDALRATGVPAGIGLGLFLAHSGLGESEQLMVTLVDGELLVYTGAAEMGQGLDRLIRLVAADSWGEGLPPVRVVSGSTIAAPPSRGTFASRSAIFVGSAVRDACQKLLDAAAAGAAQRLGAPVVRTPDGFRDDGGNSVGWNELGPLTARGEHRDPEFAFGFGGHVALVSLDVETGEPRIERLIVGYDCGRAIDPAGVEGQLVGAAVMGIGGTLYEELRYDEYGQPLSTTFMDYLVPTLAEVPAIDTVVFEYPATGNPLGAKGAGEAGVIGVGAAVANALADALGRPDGLTQLPLTAERILDA